LQHEDESEKFYAIPSRNVDPGKCIHQSELHHFTFAYRAHFHTHIYSNRREWKCERMQMSSTRYPWFRLNLRRLAGLRSGKSPVSLVSLIGGAVLPRTVSDVSTGSAEVAPHSSPPLCRHIRTSPHPYSLYLHFAATSAVVRLVLYHFDTQLQPHLLGPRIRPNSRVVSLGVLGSCAMLVQ
jgi:hypothetical protein